MKVVPIRAIAGCTVAVFASFDASAGARSDGMPTQNIHAESPMMMHEDATAAYSDRAYLSGMIVHHRAAVEMSKTVVEKGSDPQVRTWAEAIIEGQDQEIRQMQGWVGALGGEDHEAAKDMQTAMAKMTDAPGTGNADRDFIRMMIEHHAGALFMATGALVHSDDDRVITLSRRIIETQASQIVDFRSWLKKHGG